MWGRGTFAVAAERRGWWERSLAALEKAGALDAGVRREVASRVTWLRGALK